MTPASISRRSRRAWFAALAVLWAGVLCALPATAPLAAAAPAAPTPAPIAPAAASPAQPFGTPRLLVDNGARAAWSPSRRRQHIAFDAVVDENNRNMAVFTVDAQGGQRTCITCGTAVPNGFVGMMDWLPDGRHLLVSAESEHSQHRRFNQPSFGIDNDLWLVSTDGKRAERIWRSSQRGGAVLNARVDRRGKLLFFAERVPTGTQLPTALRQFGAWGEDVWAGWHLHVAEIDLRKRGEAVLRNHRVLLPNGPGFYESSGFTPQGGMLYAHSAPGRRFSDDVWHIARESAAPVNLTARADSWDEHGLYSPDQRWFGFVSSRFDGGLRYPGADNAELSTELFLQRRDAAPVRASAFNLPVAAASAASARTRRVVSRIAFSPDSRQVLMQVTQADRTAPAQLWVLDLPR